MSEQTQASRDVVECPCPCHQPGMVAMHCAPCCQGRCWICRKWFMNGLKEHVAQCRAANCPSQPTLPDGKILEPFTPENPGPEPIELYYVKGQQVTISGGQRPVIEFLDKFTTATDEPFVVDVTIDD